MTSQRLTIAAGLATLLGALPLAGAFADLAWFGYCVLAVAIVVFLGLAARALRVPAAVVPLVQLAGLLVFHAAAFSSDVARWGVLPTPSTLRAMVSTYHQAMDAVQTMAPPVPTDQPIVMLTSMAIGLVAIAIDVVSASLRRPAIAGLGLLALYAVGTSVSRGVSWQGFLFAGVGFLILLLAEGQERIAAWGRLIGSSGEDTDRGPRQGTATRIGVAALAVAVLVPIAVPGFSANLLTDFGRSGSGDGPGHSGRTGTRIDPFTTLRGQLNDDRTYNLLSVKTSVSDPYYLRTAVLDDYTGGGWRQGGTPKTVGADGQLPQPPDVAQRQNKKGATRQVVAHVDVRDYNGTSLPIYYSASGVQVDTGQSGGWKYDPTAGTVSGHQAENGWKYSTTSIEPRYTNAELEKATVPTTGMASYLALPKLAPSVITTTKDAIGNNSGPFDKAVSIYNFFTDGTQTFRYSLTTKGGTTGNDLADFLQQRQGFCEQYSSAMAVMLRLEKIPSRVVLGYTPERQDDGSWVVTNKDAHAWVEAYFSGIGWVAFDPTPDASDRIQVPDYMPTGPGGSTGDTGPTAPVVQPSARPQQQTSSAHQSTAAAAGSDGRSGGGGISPAALLSVVAAIVLLLLLASPLLARTVMRRRRLALAGGPDPVRAAHNAWEELLATARDHGLRQLPTDSPRATVARLLSLLSPAPPASAALRLVALAEERARYARDAGVDGDLRTATNVARASIAAGAPNRARFVRFLLPPSVITDLRRSIASGRARMRASVRSLGDVVLGPVRRLTARPRAHRAR